MHSWILLLILGTVGFTFRRKLWIVWCSIVLIGRGLRQQIGPLVNRNKHPVSKKPDKRLNQLPKEVRVSAEAVSTNSPCFAVSSENIEFLFTPEEFLESILERLRSAQKRIVVAALYLGVTDRCRLIADAIDYALSNNKELSVTILVDYGRGLRKENGVSVMTLLTPLIEKHGTNRVKTCMFMVPLCGAVFRHAPATIREIAGVQHIKTFITDDSTLITGANMNDDYFTTRQDRYIWVHSQPNLANWMAEYVRTLASMSYLCIPSGDGDVVPTFPSGISHPVYSGPSPSPVHEFSEDLCRKIIELLEFKEPDSVEGDTFVLPMAQLAAVGIDHESTTMDAILKNLPHGADLTFSSAYLNPTDEFINFLDSSPYRQLRVIAPAEDASGFYGASGPKGLVPPTYSKLISGFLKKLDDSSVCLNLWSKSNHTYHGKGVWVPYGTVIGSSNYGHRSKFLDAELQAFIVTSSQDLAKQFDKELSNLLSQTIETSHDRLSHDLPFKDRVFISLLTNILYPFL